MRANAAVVAPMGRSSEVFVVFEIEIVGTFEIPLGISQLTQFFDAPLDGAATSDVVVIGGIQFRHEFLYVDFSRHVADGVNLVVLLLTGTADLERVVLFLGFELFLYVFRISFAVHLPRRLGF